MVIGCGEGAVKIIVVPASTGGIALIVWYFAVAGFFSIFEPHKTITPEQVQQQQIAIQKREIEQKYREEMDLPAGLTPSSNNFVYANGTLALSVVVVESKTMSPDHNFQIYYKNTQFRNSVWQKAEIINIEVQNPDNLENAGLVDRRLLFNVKNTVWSDNKIVVTWDN